MVGARGVCRHTANVAHPRRTNARMRSTDVFLHTAGSCRPVDRMNRRDRTLSARSRLISTVVASNPTVKWSVQIRVICMLSAGGSVLARRHFRISAGQPRLCLWPAVFWVFVRLPARSHRRLPGRRRRPAATTGMRSSGPVISETSRVSGQVIRGSSHGGCQPPRQATREGATVAVTVSPPWRPGRTAPLSFGRVLVTAAGRRKLSARAG